MDRGDMWTAWAQSYYVVYPTLSYIACSNSASLPPTKIEQPRLHLGALISFRISRTPRIGALKRYI